MVPTFIVLGITILNTGTVAALIYIFWQPMAAFTTMPPSWYAQYAHRLIPVSYAQTGLKLQTRRKKISLTTKPALVIRMSIVCANGRFNMLGCPVPA